jgi:serine protease
MSRTALTRRLPLARLFTYVLVAAAAIYSASAQAGEGGVFARVAPTQDTTDRLIVRYRDEERAAIQMHGAARALGIAQRLSAAAGVQLTPLRETGGDATVLALDREVPLAQVEAIARRVADDPAVLYAEPDRRMFAQSADTRSAPNDPRYAEQWHYFEAAGGINMPAAWNITSGVSRVVVAVIDTGVRPHADFGTRLLRGYDFVSRSSDGNDGNGRDDDASDPGDACPPRAPRSSWHGTHVAGTIGAGRDNGYGVVGVAPRTRLLPVRVLGKCGGYTSDIVDGMRWAAGLAVPKVPANATPARVLNLSLGGSGACPASYRDAIDAITKAGAVVVVAAGNSNTSAANFAPANCPGVITVAATTRTGARAPYSNYGTRVEIAAPGGDTSLRSADGILSTLDSGATTPSNDTFGFYQGTSMATPHVAGVVALMLAANATLTPAEILQILQSTARKFPTGTGRDCTTERCGAGIVDAGRAVAEAKRVKTAGFD